MTFLGNVFKGKANTQRSDRWIFGTMLVFGAIGLVMALLISIERYHQMLDPSAPMLCNFNLILNCGEVMKTWQARVFGFPNSFIGLMGFSVVITVAVVGLAKFRFPRWFLTTAQICYGLGLLFAYWLFFQSVYVIQILCPLCLVVTFATTVVFETLLRYNLRENTFKLPGHINTTVQDWLKKDYDKVFVAGWLALLTVLVFLQFPGLI